ncbi:hypothetical protein [Lishizhenia tianjinensis]|nr:hypothetical protein [Lishizhenia tianjinensis]
MKTIKLLVLGLCLPFLGAAQTTTPALRINEAFMSLGAQGSFEPGLSQATFEKLSENSTLLPDNIGSSYTYFGNNTFKLGVGLQFRDREKSGFRKHMELRVGLAYSNSLGYYSSSGNSTKHPYDTLVSQQTGQEYYIDSIYSEYTTVHHNFDMLSIDASLIFRTNSEARWSLYGGLGASFGSSLFSKTYLRSGSNGYTIGAQSGNSHSWSTNNSESETYTNGSNTSLTAYVPIGVDFRIANNNAFFNKMHLYTEITPNFTMRNINNLETISSASVGFNFGAYYRF